MRIIRQPEIDAMPTHLDRAAAHGANADEYWRRAEIAMRITIVFAVLAVVAGIATMILAAV